MQKLFEYHRVMVKSFESSFYYPRQCLSGITLDNHVTAVLGHKGVGKTTFLLEQARFQQHPMQKALYVAADNIYFLENTLLDLVDRLYKETSVKLLCLDEVHKYPNWQQELKNIADIYREFKVLCSGSSMIDLIRGKYDLSRRVTSHYLYGLSFREFLEFYYKIKLPIIKFQELMKDPSAFNNTLSYPDALRHFNEYLRVGYYPSFHRFTQEAEKFQTIVNATQSTIFEEIAIQHQLKTPTLLTIELLFKYVLQSLPGELNVNKIAIALQKDHESVKTYLHLLEQAGLIRFLTTADSGKKQLKLPIKIYPENSNLIFAYFLANYHENSVGKIRETFAMNQLYNAGLSVHYPKAGDFLVEGWVIEVGGKNKTNSQIKNVKQAAVFADGILAAFGSKIPLYYLGFLY